MIVERTPVMMTKTKRKTMRKTRRMMGGTPRVMTVVIQSLSPALMKRSMKIWKYGR